MKSVQIYTDGACSGNPGPGGWGAILIYGDVTKELSGGEQSTTNNRMELSAVISSLRSLKEPCNVDIYSDSQYIVNAITKGWAEKWKRNNWMRNPKEKALNADLWEQLLSLCEMHSIEFFWVKGHAQNKFNNRCDELAVMESRKFL